MLLGFQVELVHPMLKNLHQEKTDQFSTPILMKKRRKFIASVCLALLQNNLKRRLQKKRRPKTFKTKIARFTSETVEMKPSISS